MVIRFFRKNYFFQYFFFFVFAISLWLDVLIKPAKINIGQLSTGAAWLDAAFGHFPLMLVILFLGLLVFQALYLNQIHDYHRLAERNQMLVAVFYLILMGSAPILVRPNMMIVVNFLLILLMNIIFNILGENEPYRQVFDASILVSIASLFYFPAIFFIFFIWLCFIVYQIFTWREWLISIIAFVLPYIFLGTFFLYTNELPKVAIAFVTRFMEIKPVIVQVNPYSYIVWGLLFFLVLSVFSRIIKGISESSVDLQKKNRVVLLFLFIVAVSAVYSGENFRMHLTLAATPVSMIFGTYFSQSKKQLLAEIITLLLLAVIFAGKFMTLK